ncbi:uncharacterized protein LOC111864559 [Cryptotermes secundus]|uniref:uncharacterized protein LOC111864559 n=1 Tax=Cryptotermes secundus TaxID=105785 RepID=UPI000CD7C777|nr:uncharacterized protein LOC111864559 [Cryptotermes secundus]
MCICGAFSCRFIYYFSVIRAAYAYIREEDERLNMLKLLGLITGTVLYWLVKRTWGIIRGYFRAMNTLWGIIRGYFREMNNTLWVCTNSEPSHADNLSKLSKLNTLYLYTWC